MHFFKYIGSKESARELWENRESLNKYLEKLKELMCIKINEITPVYCDQMPKEIEAGKLYISKEYRIAIHLCACGCGVKTVTPIKEGEWSLTENNGNITLRPSIGNFSGENPYHAHYYITDNKIQWL